jgi:copper chaperone NosL
MSRALLLTRRQAIITLSALAWTMACGRRPDDQPAPVTYGRDECAWCRMTVDDPRLVAQWTSPGTTAQIFGEPGCLLAWLSAHPGAAGTAWVRTHDRDQWLRAGEAVFVPDLVRTPMSFHLAAFTAVPAGAGTTLTWAGLREKGAPDARPS